MASGSAPGGNSDNLDKSGKVRVVKIPVSRLERLKKAQPDNSTMTAPVPATERKRPSKRAAPPRKDASQPSAARETHGPTSDFNNGTPTHDANFDLQRVLRAVGHKQAKSSKPSSSACPPPQQLSIETRPCYFLALPLELREEIYTLSFEDLPSSLTYDFKDRCPGPLPPVCYTSKEIWTEAGLAYLRRTEFKFHMGYLKPSQAQAALIRWLSSFPHNQGFQAIRKLSFIPGKEKNDYVDGFKYYRDSLTRAPHHLVSRCPGLQTLSLAFSGDNIIKVVKIPEHWTAGNPPVRVEAELQHQLCTVEEIWDKGDCQALFSLKNLRTLRVKLDGRAAFILDLQGPDAAELYFANLMTAIRMGYKQRGGEVDITVEYERL